MSPWQRLSAESSDLLEQTGIPRKVISRLLAALRLGVGFSVLEVGCGRGELAKFFDSLGIQCTGIDESPKNVLDARRNVPNCSFSCASVNDPLPSVRTEFDVVLIRDSAEYHRPLQTRAAYAATLKLIGRLPPAGCIAFLSRVGHGESDSASHTFGCYTRHLGALPGHQDFQEIPDGLRILPSIHGQSASKKSSGHAIAVLRLPQLLVAPETWSWAVERALRADAAPCCAWSVSEAAPRSKAA
ncbi:MAG TPA: class I SAM-dependent methyltransferase [Planctomycetaceae bacterium]|jgi:SAM-dependent methyltransferase|nr:class I SAM-dependent methyltransferase [Planctomycetaceae bacterium]